jgi:hypothetical protein
MIDLSPLGHAKQCELENRGLFPSNGVAKLLLEMTRNLR